MGAWTVVSLCEHARRPKFGSTKEHKIRLRDVFCLQRPGECRREDTNKGRVTQLRRITLCETDNRCLATRRPCVVIDEWPLGHSSLFGESPGNQLVPRGDRPYGIHPTCCTRTAAMAASRRMVAVAVGWRRNSLRKKFEVRRTPPRVEIRSTKFEFQRHRCAASMGL
jgi:hypothetical protein